MACVFKCWDAATARLARRLSATLKQSARQLTWPQPGQNGLCQRKPLLSCSCYILTTSRFQRRVLHALGVLRRQQAERALCSRASLGHLALLSSCMCVLEAPPFDTLSPAPWLGTRPSIQVCNTQIREHQSKLLWKVCAGCILCQEANCEAKHDPPAIPDLILLCEAKNSALRMNGEIVAMCAISGPTRVGIECTCSF